jgi:hypothetical protein
MAGSHVTKQKIDAFSFLANLAVANIVFDPGDVHGDFGGGGGLERGDKRGVVGKSGFLARPNPDKQDSALAKLFSASPKNGISTFTKLFLKKTTEIFSNVLKAQKIICNLLKTTLMGIEEITGDRLRGGGQF